MHLVSDEGGVSGGTTPGAGAWRIVLLVDDLSRYMWVAAIPSKGRAAAAIKDIQVQTEGEFGLKLKALRTDREGEFTATEFMDYCATEDVHRQHTTPYSPRQNDIVERRNRTVVATTKSMLKVKDLPRWF
jgi:transposase InsO family protein